MQDPAIPSDSLDSFLLKYILKNIDGQPNSLWAIAGSGMFDLLILPGLGQTHSV